MEIKKADSKGRITGFSPGTYYEIYEAGGKTYFAIYQYGFSVGNEADIGKREWLQDEADENGFELTVKRGQ